MPVPLGLVPLNEIDPVTGFISQMIIAELDGYGDADTQAEIDAYTELLTGQTVRVAKKRDVSASANKGFHPVQPIGYDYNIMAEGENINVPYYTGDASDTKDASGSTTIGGSLMLPAITEGTELIFSALLQSLNPTAVNRTGVGEGSGTTARTAVVSVAGIDPVHAANNDTLQALTVAVHTAPTNPTRARISFGDGVRVDAGGLGKITITGTCQDGEGGITTVKEEFDVFPSGAAKPPDILSDVYFLNITASESSGFGVGTAGATRIVTIDQTDESKVVTFEANDSALVRFWLMEIVKGITPNLYTGVIPTGMSFEISRNAAIILNTTFTGRRDRLYKDLNFRDDDAAVKTAINGAGNELAAASTEIYTGWQCEVVLNGVPAPFTTGTFNYNPNLTPTEAVSQKRWEEVKPVRATRNVNADLTAIFSRQNNFAKIFKNNVTIRNIEVNVVHSPAFGFPWRISFQIPQGQVVSLPEVETPQGLVTQALNIKSFGSGIGLAVPDDMKIIADYSFYNPVRAYTI